MTKKGDKGETSLLGGTMVSKSHSRIEAIGAVDELVAWIGVLRVLLDSPEVQEQLRSIQEMLFALNAVLAHPMYKQKTMLARLDVAQIEQWAEELEEALPPLKHFVIPGVRQGESFIHLSRAVCRRAERSVVRVKEESVVPGVLVVFLNRLSDYLFLLARAASDLDQENKQLWSGQQSPPKHKPHGGARDDADEPPESPPEAPAKRAVRVQTFATRSRPVPPPPRITVS